MKSRHFFLTLLMMIVAIPAAKACTEYYEPYSASAFFILPTHSAAQDHDPTRFDDETIDFWHNYTGGAVSRNDIRKFLHESKTVSSSQNPLALWLKKRNDTSAISLLDACIRFNKMNDAYNESLWDYDPLSTSELASFAESIKVPTTGKLQGRWLFLKIRALFTAGLYDRVIALWDSKGKSMPDSTLRTRMEGYYAGALYRTRQYVHAAEIYYRLGDATSIAWCMEHLNGLESLTQLVNDYPQSPATLFTLQDYVNYLIPAAQIDLYSPYYRFTQDDIDRSGEYQPFLALCDKVLAEKKIRNLMDWGAAKAIVQAYRGNGQQALDSYDAALKLDGSKASIENLARVKAYIDLVNSTSSATAAGSFTHSLKKLMDDAKHETAPYSYNWEVYKSPLPAYNFLSNFLLPEAMRIFEAAGQATVRQAAICTIYKNISFDSMLSPLLFMGNHMNSADLKRMDSLADGDDADSFDAALVSLAHPDRLLITDALGSALLREGKYEEALKCFDSLPNKWIAAQNVYPYLAGRALRATIPFGRHQMAYAEHLPSKVQNVKAQYCRDLITANDKVTRATDNLSKANALYELAAVQYQGSRVGDLWATTSYYWSSTDTDRDPMIDAAYANLLKARDLVTSPETKSAIELALLRLPVTGADPIQYEYDWRNDQYFYSINRLTDPQKQALQYIRDNWSQLPAAVRSCDVMKDYVAGRFR